MDLKFILGRKKGMTQIFTSEGEMIPVTLVKAGPCFVLQVKTCETDGYAAVQVGFWDQKINRISKPMKGHFKKAGLSSDDSGGDKKKASFRTFRYVKEFRVPDPSAYKAGDEIKVDIFEEGDLVDVIGRSKGRGFAGVMKRWNFKGGPAGHGAMCDRRPGSIGMHSDPSRVFKGKKMAGHHGAARITVKNLQVIGTDHDHGVLLLKGSIPGARNGLLHIRTARTGIPKKAGSKEKAAAS